MGKSRGAWVDVFLFSSSSWAVFKSRYLSEKSWYPYGDGSCHNCHTGPYSDLTVQEKTERVEVEKNVNFDIQHIQNGRGSAGLTDWPILKWPIHGFEFLFWITWEPQGLGDATSSGSKCRQFQLSLCLVKHRQFSCCPTTGPRFCTMESNHHIPRACYFPKRSLAPRTHRWGKIEMSWSLLKCS